MQKLNLSQLQENLTKVLLFQLSLVKGQLLQNLKHRPLFTILKLKKLNS